jgi:hypothetical protein
VAEPPVFFIVKGFPMSTENTESPILRGFQGLILGEHPTTGTQDDDDDPNDESAGENEAPVRETDENTEAPEEFEVDDEDELGHPEDDDADDDDDDEEEESEK